MPNCFFLFHDLVIFPLDGFFVRVCFSSFCFGFFIIIIILVCSVVVVVVVVVVFVYLQLSSLGIIFPNILSPPVRQAAAILFYPFNVSPPPSIVNHCPFCIL